MDIHRHTSNIKYPYVYLYISIKIYDMYHWWILSTYTVRGYFFFFFFHPLHH